MSTKKKSRRPNRVANKGHHVVHTMRSYRSCPALQAEPRKATKTITVRGGSNG